MIHRIEIENYRSIREKQVIGLTLPATTPEMDRFVTSHGQSNVRLPTVVAFFGPNASGKTSVISAIANTIDFVLNSFDTPPDAPINNFCPFRSREQDESPTRVVIDFDAQWIGATARLYRYQLVIGNGPEHDAERVLAESLLIKHGKRFRSLFKRDETGIRCAPEFGLPPSSDNLKAAWRRYNASLISTMAKNGHPIFQEAWKDIYGTQRNIRGIKLSYHNIENVLKYLHQNDDALDDLRDQLKRLDFGLKDINIEQDRHGFHAKFSHRGLDQDIFDFEESNGTLRFISIFPLLWFTLKTGRPALVDEFDVNLHPLLVPELLNWFHDPETNPHKAQLFLAAHNVAILDYLEKEEVFLVEKSSDGASNVIPLRSIQGIRREPSLQRKYLGGVFGAVPNIG